MIMIFMTRQAFEHVCTREFQISLCWSGAKLSAYAQIPCLLIINIIYICLTRKLLHGISLLLIYIEYHFYLIICDIIKIDLLGNYWNELIVVYSYDILNFHFDVMFMSSFKYITISYHSFVCVCNYG